MYFEICHQEPLFPAHALISSNILKLCEKYSRVCSERNISRKNAKMLQKFVNIFSGKKIRKTIRAARINCATIVEFSVLICNINNFISLAIFLSFCPFTYVQNCVKNCAFFKQNFRYFRLFCIFFRKVPNFRETSFSFCCKHQWNCWIIDFGNFHSFSKVLLNLFSLEEKLSNVKLPNFQLIIVVLK